VKGEFIAGISKETDTSISRIEIIYVGINSLNVSTISSRPVIPSLSQAKLFSWVSVVPEGLEGLLYQYGLITNPTGVFTASPPHSGKHYHITLSK
jgi:hypothetical protein